MLGVSAKFLSLLLTSAAVFIIASKRHNEAYEENQFDSHAQCGHWVFYRSSQLLGIDIGKQQLASLPMRDAGMTVRELAKGLKRVGFGVEVRLGEYHVEQDRIAVLKLNSPDHFVVVSRGVDGRLQYHVDYKAVVEGESKNIDTRYSGVWLEVTRPKIERFSGPGISFNTLVIDTGVLEFYEHLGKTPWFVFEVTNHGDKPLRIENVQVGCDCVKVEWPKDEIAIDEVVEIRAQYIPRISKDNGFFQQHFVVASNDPKRPLVTLERQSGDTQSFACRRRRTIAVVTNTLSVPKAKPTEERMAAERRREEHLQARFDQWPKLSVDDDIRLALRAILPKPEESNKDGCDVGCVAERESDPRHSGPRHSSDGKRCQVDLGQWPIEIRQALDGTNYFNR